MPNFIQFKSILCIIMILSGNALCCPSDSFAKPGGLPVFSEYKSNDYRGIIHIPRGYRNDNGYWRDENGKSVERPEINFSERYYIALHSCGFGCRYYTIVDLSDGHNRNFLDMFANTEETPSTKDGNNYITGLIFQRESSLIIARYSILNKNGREVGCRTRYFTIIDEITKPITGTINECVK